MEKKSISLKPIIKMLTFQHNFESISKKFGAADSIKVSLKKKEFDFPIDFNTTGKSDILNIHKYLIIKNKRKWYSGLLNKYLLYYWVSLDL